MREIGIKELKATLSETLRTAERGEQIRVTSRGRPIADIVPAGTSDRRLRTLVAEGRFTPPSRSLPDRAPRRAKTSESASHLVLSERDAER